METLTQRRGPADTSDRRFVKLLVVSLLLHVPFTPWAALVGLIGLWSPLNDETPSPPITSIPIDLLEEQAPSAPTEPAAAADNAAVGEPSAPKPKPKPKPQTKPEKIRDAGEPDAENSDAGESDAGDSDAGKLEADAGEKHPDAGTPIADAGPSDAGAHPLADPAVAVGVKRVVDPNANVRITIYTSNIRQNPIGKRLGPLLRSLYQWRDFFGPTAIDPIRDIDQIVIFGPQLRDSSNVVAILKHHVPPDRMHTAVDALVRADHAGGMWLDAGVPAASAHADGTERRFILANSTTVIVTPPSAYAGALAYAGKNFQLLSSPGPEVALIYLATPWRALIGWPLQVPHTIKWTRVRITPSADGGAIAEADAEDENESLAQSDADYLTRTANSLSQLNLGLLGSLLGQQTHKFIEHVSFSTNGKMIRGEAKITADQLASALDLAGAFLAERQARRDHNAAPAPSASH